MPGGLSAGGCRACRPVPGWIARCRGRRGGWPRTAGACRPGARAAGLDRPRGRQAGPAMARSRGGQRPAGEDGEPVEPDRCLIVWAAQVAAQVARAQVVGPGQPAQVGRGALPGHRPRADRQRARRAGVEGHQAVFLAAAGAGGTRRAWAAWSRSTASSSLRVIFSLPSSRHKQSVTRMRPATRTRSPRSRRSLVGSHGRPPSRSPAVTAVRPSV